MDMTQSSFRGRVYVAWSEFPGLGSPPDGASQILLAASSRTSPLEFSPLRKCFRPPRR